MDDALRTWEKSHDYIWLKNLSREDRIQALYNQTPHSLSRVCLQLIDIGCATEIDDTWIVDDMAYAIWYFGGRAALGDKRAIDTLWRFSNHMSGNGRLRYNYVIKLAGNKTYFDTELTTAYENAVGQLRERPKLVRYVKDITEDTAHAITTVIDTTIGSEDDK